MWLPRDSELITLCDDLAGAIPRYKCIDPLPIDVTDVVDDIDANPYSSVYRGGWKKEESQ